MAPTYLTVKLGSGLRDPGGQQAPAKVRFTPNAPLRNGTTTIGTVERTVGYDGTLDGLVAATDDPATDPQQAAYLIEIIPRGEGEVRSFYAQLPHAAVGGVVDLETLVPLTPPPALVSDALGEHTADTTNVHGIVDTAALATATSVAAAVTAHAGAADPHGDRAFATAADAVVAARVGALELDEYATTAQTAAVTAAGMLSKLIRYDTTGGAISQTLPAATVGARFGVSWEGGTAALTLIAAGSDVIGSGSATSAVVPVPEVLVYHCTTAGRWRTVAGFKPISSLDARYGRPAVVAPAATGVAATDTPALQAAITATPTGGRLFLSSSSTAYALNAALSITKSITIEGDGIAPTFTSVTSSGNPTTPSSPFLAGTVIKQTAEATDILSITTTSISVSLHRVGLLFASGLASTGHGINASPSLVVGSGHDMGLTDFEWDSVYVHGHDGNHYGAVLLNPQYGTIVNFRAYGGGGINVQSDAGAINSGNLVLVHPYNSLFNSGTAGGFVHTAATAATPGTLNLLTYIRPQCILGGAAKTAATQYMWDDNNGAASPKSVTVVAPDLESTGNPVRFGTDTAIVGGTLISGSSRPYPATSFAIGTGAMPNPTGGNQTAIGYQALAAVGSGAISGTVTGNTAVGYQSLTAATAGNNTAVGSQAANAVTSGNNGTAVGGQSMLTGNGANNTAVGYQSLKAAAADSNTVVGYQALSGLTGGIGKSVVVGASAGNGTFPTTGGDSQTLVGYQSGQAASGNYSKITCLGYHALASGNSALALGAETSAAGAGAVAIGTDSGGTGASTTTSNAFVLGTANHKVQIKNNTTGAGSAALGGNCPAVTATAPYTWFAMLSSDGSTVYVPAWK